MLRNLLLTALLFCCCSAAAVTPGYHDQVLTVRGEDWIMRLPDGMQLELLTDRLDAPRMLTFLPNGDLLAGSRSGNIYRLPPPYREPEVLLQLGDYPHSVAWRDGELLIAQTDGLYRAPYRPGQARIAPGSVTRLIALPGGGGHNSRTVAIGPDGRVYLSLGISGNCSDQYLGTDYPFQDRRGGVLVLDEGGPAPAWQTFASGLRNPVGFDWQPQTGALYASNNGPDHLGFEQPPEVFAGLSAGSFHGMPWFQFDGRKLQRDRCIGSDPPRAESEVRLPRATFPARSAPLGVAFVPAGGPGGDRTRQCPGRAARFLGHAPRRRRLRQQGHAPAPGTADGAVQRGRGSGRGRLRDRVPASGRDAAGTTCRPGIRSGWRTIFHQRCRAGGTVPPATAHTVTPAAHATADRSTRASSCS